MSRTVRHIIGITGGIGSGKSVVSGIVAAMGYKVYDCDAQAKRIMDSTPSVARQIASRIHPSAIDTCGRINRPVLSKLVFGNPEMLAQLNLIVHSMVRADFRKWVKQHKVAFIESAILYSSKLDKEVTEIWEITAPLDLRVQRIVKRNPQLTYDDIRRRIEAQRGEWDTMRGSNTHLIVNDEFTPLIPQIERLLR